MGDRGHLGWSSPSKEPPSCAHDWNRDGNSEAMDEESLACLFPDCVHASQSCTLQGRACLDPHPAPSNVRSAVAVVHPVPDVRHAAPASEAGVMSEPQAPLSRPVSHSRAMPLRRKNHNHNYRHHPTCYAISSPAEYHRESLPSPGERGTHAVSGPADSTRSTPGTLRETWHGSSPSLRMKASEQAVSRKGQAVGAWSCDLLPSSAPQARRDQVPVAEKRVKTGD